jgi:hypothetical protein
MPSPLWELSVPLLNVIRIRDLCVVKHFLMSLVLFCEDSSKDHDVCYREGEQIDNGTMNQAADRHKNR